MNPRLYWYRKFNRSMASLQRMARRQHFLRSVFGREDGVLDLQISHAAGAVDRDYNGWQRALRRA